MLPPDMPPDAFAKLLIVVAIPYNWLYKPAEPWLGFN